MNCKVALMTSSCGDDAGKLAYHMTALMTSESPVACPVRPLTDDYRGDMLVLLFFIGESAAFMSHAYN